MNVFKAIQVYYLCNIPEKVRFRGTGFMKQNYTTHWKIHHTGKMLPASSENADLHFCGEMAARDHTGRKQRRKTPLWVQINRYNVQGTIHACRQK